MKKLRYVFMALVLVQISTTAFAQDFEKHGGHHSFSDQPMLNDGEASMGQKIEMFFKILDLDPEQKEQLKDLIKERQNLKEQMQSVQKERLELNRLLRSSVSSDTEIRQQADVFAKLMQKVNNERLNNLLKIKKILRPEQFERLMAKLEQRHGRPGSDSEGHKPGRKFFKKRME